MQLADEIALCRILLSEKTQNRWTDADLTTLINRGRQQVSFDTSWPEVKFSTSTVSGQREYALPEQQKILRVYIGGQLLLPTSIPNMDGSILQQWDEAGSANKPQWLTEPQSTYPQANSFTGVQTANAPWAPMGRAVFYLRGGYIGIVPIPAGVYTLNIDAVAIPNVLVNPGDYDIYPDNFKDAICWYAVAYALFADKDPMSAQAMQQYESASLKLKDWRNEMQAFRPKTPGFIPYRTLFSDSGTADPGRGNY